MPHLLSSIVRGFASLLLPPSCPRCGVGVEGEALPCPRCDEELAALWEEVDPRGAPDLSFPFPFAGAARDLIHRTKYEGNLPAANFLGSLMAARLSGDLGDPGAAILVPVPLHPVRLRERGFNQAERLARAVARTIGLDVHTDILVRTRAGVSQTTLDPEARRLSVAGAFTARRLPPSSRLVIVDDVWTTGATAEACRAALREAGCRGPVHVLVAARPPLWRGRPAGPSGRGRRPCGSGGREPRTIPAGREPEPID